jgi:hypothetical protein
MPEVRYSELHREFKEGKPRAWRLLERMAWVIPFERRVDLSRDLVKSEKDQLPNEALPEHLRGRRIKVRRNQLLEDGYVQLGALPSDALKGTIRVEFVNSLGVVEAGIDRHGVFKEFMEDILSQAFNPQRGYFCQTGQRHLYPNPASGAADPQRPSAAFVHGTGEMKFVLGQGPRHELEFPAMREKRCHDKVTRRHRQGAERR